MPTNTGFYERYMENDVNEAAYIDKDTGRIDWENKYTDENLIYAFARKGYPGMSSPDLKKRLALAFIDFLSKSLQDGTVSAEDKDSVEVAQSCIAEIFHVDPSDDKAMKEAIGDQSLASIYGVYDRLRVKPTAASTSGTTSSAKDAHPSNPTNASASSTKAPNAEAETFKSQGNAAMKSQNYKDAIDSYTKALNLAPTNVIYLANRSAAYNGDGQYLQASNDAELAIAADPTYVKGWSRLGVARLALNDPKGSVEAYEKGIEYEGNGGSETMKKALATAKSRLEAKEKEDADADIEPAREEGPRAGGGGGAGGLPDLTGLAGMLGGGGGGGGMPDLANIMNNPMFANMAQNLMSNPDAMRNLMNNPQVRDLASRFGGGQGGGGGGSGGSGGSGDGGSGGSRGGGGGGGGMPDLSAMMNDPSIAEMARNFMGGGQGGRGGGTGGGR